MPSGVLAWCLDVVERARADSDDVRQRLDALERWLREAVAPEIVRTQLDVASGCLGAGSGSRSTATCPVTSRWRPRSQKKPNRQVPGTRNLSRKRAVPKSTVMVSC
ncbi:unnamed protein product [Polarella glacialis]|uniref:Uncharacterized protein n=1 Tax=Polarella glacialis TaxID=89957 RepID=A0A813DJY2_POLGL|nr:unnamed protein product [Polarella glacialis]